MRGTAGRTVLLVTTLSSLWTPSAEAYRRLRFGPFEIVPQFAVEVRQHSNVFVTSDEAAAGNPNSAKVSGVIIDLRPGLNIVAKSGLEKRIRGFYLDLHYNPALVLFPGAQQNICIGGSGPECTNGRIGAPDRVKLDQNVALGLRYQSSGRLTFSGGVNYSHPEIAKADFAIKDFSAHLGAYNVAIETADHVAAARNLATIRTTVSGLAEPLLRWTAGLHEAFEATMAGSLVDR